MPATPTTSCCARYGACPRHSVSHAVKVGDLGSGYGSVYTCGSVGIVSINRKVSGVIKPWTELYSGNLPGGLSSMVSCVSLLAIDCTGGAEVCVAVSGSNVSIGSRSDANIAISGEQYMRGSIAFPLA